MSEGTAVKIIRDGKLPLKFTGTVIGQGDNHVARGERQSRWTVVRIYRTVAEKIVIEVVNQSTWGGEEARVRAEVVTSAADAIKWLETDNHGELGSVSQEALTKAAANDPEFAAAYVETVE